LVIKAGSRDLEGATLPTNSLRGLGAISSLKPTAAPAGSQYQGDKFVALGISDGDVLTDVAILSFFHLVQDALIFREDLHGNDHQQDPFEPGLHALVWFVAPKDTAPEGQLPLVMVIVPLPVV
jgi:hypothetical protein